MNFRLGALLIATTLSACVTPPSDLPKGTPLEAGTLGLGGAPVHPVPDQWWKAYGDPQLDRLVERALDRNPGLAQAMSRLDDANARLGVARAPRLPKVTLDGTELREQLSERDIIPPPYGGQWIWRGEVGLNLSWDLDFWGRQTALIDSADLRSQASRLDIETARLVLAGSLARSYLQLDHAYRLADLAQQAELQRTQLEKLTRRRVEAGLDTQVDLRDAQAAVPLSRIDASDAQASVERAVHALAALTSDGADAYAGISRPQVALQTQVALPTELPANLLARRPDVIAARLRVEAADAQRLAAKAAFYPDVDLTAFAGFGAIGLDNLLVGDAAQMGFGPRFHLPVFDAKRLKAEYHEANADIDAAIAIYNATVLQAVQQVADRLTDIRAATRELAEQQTSLEHAEAGYGLAEKRYRAGLANRLVVLNAETRVLDARRHRIDLIDAMAQSRVALLLALGGSFDPAATASSSSFVPIAAATTAQVTP
ncbi:NodT family efflux transporter outer membrane factor (OMF) lipoprotein [Panacagrimonas perspica]|uniref:NodT family efflux transporter outer membrane factor (OMF) lipoprotein n=1 Tax=Panacagrimonas perspica TaxID=381431 RepID=A0A4S3K686_9GAMM|nr:efflux transporter outer membrane subunit [Panacagrimonas perspica]TDU26905.1 NodT family efflux transporter outer membrane factor (OMF) lipoprotein [Panacagrimonas perspica]THD03672.1 hypothetical protein B1810_09010 [Panacagrimonas perspica]